MADSLPSFDRPPVAETVLGAQFDEVKGFTSAHLGLFWGWLCERARWNHLADDWSDVTDAQPIEPAYERFPEASEWGAFRAKIRISQKAASRLQIRNRTVTRMVQIQNGRIHLNWTGEGKQEYVRYARLQPEFEELFDAMNRFAEQYGFGPLNWNQWEITYINHLVCGRDWESPGDWPALFNAVPGIPTAELPVRLDSFGATWRFEIPPELGRLHAEVRHVRIGTSDGPEALLLSLTARGSGSDRESILAGLASGRSAIVRTFAQLTSDVAQAKWGRQ
ncbi:MAG: TIGR04255 family protein [Phycisphaerales bacterium]|nr:TIGR04255 family protein [Phycisphaerales bacterium]